MRAKLETSGSHLYEQKKERQNVAEMGLQIKRLTVECQLHPLGIDVTKPRFSWQMYSERQNTEQVSYAIMVSSPYGTVWDTDKINSSQSQFVEYHGKPLAAKTRYQVKLSVEDNYGQVALTQTWFETGLMGGNNFQSHWITDRFDDCEEACPVFRKEFNVTGKIDQARLYASALGVYQVELNGEKVGDAFMAPGWTNYHKRIQYQTYDVTERLRRGENRIAVTVGKGWYKGSLGFDSRKNIYGDHVAAIAQLEIIFPDGSKQMIATDDSWQCTTGPIRSSEIYHGETIDHTFASQRFENAAVFDHATDVLVAQECEPVRITQRIKPKALIHTPKGETVLDFGQNLVGFVEAKLHCAKGTKVILKHAEVLDKDGNFYTANLRTARATDTFICSGDDDVFVPSFTFHGFRYLKVEGLSENPKLDAFTACVLHTDMKKTGDFCCSHKGITQLQSNIQWGQRGNSVDIPTDCPQRDERLGWTGDAQVFASTAAFNMQTALFFEKWLRDLASEQTEEHGVPHVIPNILGESEGAAAWSDAATIIPWTMYFAYGDTRILQEQYPSMKQWVEYIRSKAGDKNLWQTGYQYGDWLALDKEEGPGRVGATDVYLIASAFYAHSTYLVARAAKILGYMDDAQEYQKLYWKIKAAFQKEYITQTGRMVSETQTACVLALHFDLAPTQDRGRILETLKSNIAKHNNHLTTGFVGTPYLCHTLSENGEHELAGKVFLKHDLPSWLYAVDRGATTIWERWDSIKKDGNFDETGMNSFNHYAYGSIGSWMYERLAGIQIVEPGYHKSRIAPMPIKGITWVKACLETPYGTLSSSWSCKDNVLCVDVEVPANTTAIIVLPDKEKEIQVGSGTYHYEYQTAMKLEMERYSMESTLGEILDNKLAVKLLSQYIPGMTENPMLSYVRDSSITEMSTLMPPEGTKLFQLVISQINAAEE